MSILTGISITEITEAYLRGIIENRVPESFDLEFKAGLYGNSDADKREFLKDISALANTSGGHIIIGMAEKDGVAAELVGQTNISADKEMLRLENLLQTSIEPRVQRIRFQPIQLEGGGYVLIVELPRSWSPPHRVTHSGINRYYLRSSAGVFEPSVDQLRSVFLGSAERERKVQEFRIERLSLIVGEERGLRMAKSGVLAVHTYPADDRVIELPTNSALDLLPSMTQSATWRHNLEGTLIYTPADTSGRTQAYTQVFRNGRIEMVSGAWVRSPPNVKASPVIAGARLVEAIVSSVGRSVIGSSTRGASFPMVAAVSLLDCLGSRLATQYDPSYIDRLDRSDVLLEPVIIESWINDGSGAVLLPMLDALWNAFGHTTCNLVRDTQGNWKPPR